MGKLLRFTGSDRPKKRQPDASEDAKVIMFTGVRYERNRRADDDTNPAGDKRRRKHV